ncbi:MAG: TIGR03668 family PPOX class F420-dependent oxidoreductase [Solirubrobacterales bacterium]|nr:TIGR03668 family PPOX class F420-dependent oxidoreductase [Solirubrobacterales bacterium]
MSPDQARARFQESPVARLATVRPDGTPHLVPVTFALLDTDTLVTAVDHKPKRTVALARLANIRANPAVCVLVDHYEDDWTQLWWARADGHAEVVAAEALPSGVEALCRRYAAYAKRPPSGDLIVITVTRWSAWAALT